MLTSLETWFAHPRLLALLGLLPIVTWLLLRAYRKKQAALATFGNGFFPNRLLSRGNDRRFLRGLVLYFALMLLIVGMAGPQWGKEPSEALRTQRDVFVLIDVSRSMDAEQPSRRVLATRALRQLAETLSRTGGPRVALVLFAAHPTLAFPLTVDFDHFLFALDQIDADELPTAIRPKTEEGLPSGTRLGAALRFALEHADPKRPTDVILLSDGDDPAEDEEWLEGAEEARRRKVPVHVVAVGDPNSPSKIPLGMGFLTHNGKPVLSQVNEMTLQEIARRTRGVYLPAYANPLPLGKLLPNILAAAPLSSLEEEGGIGQLQVFTPRYALFLGPALALFALWLLLGIRRGNASSRLPRLAFFPVVLLLVSAAPPGVERWLRLGQEAFDRDEFDKAALQFEKAEELSLDPGQVAFNKAAALYRAQKYADAALAYQHCLEDDRIPLERRALALFQRGNALLQQSAGKNRFLVERAIASLRDCLALEKLDPSLRSDARHNLDLARHLWLKTNPDDARPEDQQHQAEPKGKHLKKVLAKSKEGKNGKDAFGKEDAGGPESKEPGNGQDPSKGKKAGVGPLTVLPDQKELVPLSQQEAEAHLEEIARRIMLERRNYRRLAWGVPENVKDW
ncbi:MAG: VWA domain-containing protein [Gemmataceae bacterium]|nr:VWA domain-containing protein [Gemmataceae bacterium]